MSTEIINKSENSFIGLDIKKDRVSKSMTLEEYSKILKIGRSYLSEIENGREPSDKVKIKFEQIKRADNKQIKPEYERTSDIMDIMNEWLLSKHKEFLKLKGLHEEFNIYLRSQTINK